MSTPAGRTVFGLDSDVLAGIAWILVGGSTAVAARRYYLCGSERG